MEQREQVADSRELLEPFSFDAVVSPSTGRQDKIELECSAFLTLHGDSDDVGSLRLYLTPELDSLRRYQNADEYQQAGHPWIFNRPPSLEKHPMEVRKRSLCMAGDEVLGAPLFSGRCFIRRPVESRQQALKSALVNLTLELNPTRFVVHQWPQDSTKRQGVNLLKHQLPYGLGAEYALDLGGDGRKPSDNWLPDKPHFVRHSQFSKPSVQSSRRRQSRQQ
jgi:hypothetical protein